MWRVFCARALRASRRSPTPPWTWSRAAWVSTPNPDMGSLAAYIRLVRENRNFRRLWLAQIVSELGDWFYSLAVYSLILELTGSARLVGLPVVVQVLPQTLAAPTAGGGDYPVRRKPVMVSGRLAPVPTLLLLMLVPAPRMAVLLL